MVVRTGGVGVRTGGVGVWIVLVMVAWCQSISEVRGTFQIGTSCGYNVSHLENFLVPTSGGWLYIISNSTLQPEKLVPMVGGNLKFNNQPTQELGNYAVNTVRLQHQVISHSSPEFNNTECLFPSEATLKISASDDNVKVFSVENTVNKERLCLFTRENVLRVNGGQALFSCRESVVGALNEFKVMKQTVAASLGLINREGNAENLTFAVSTVEATFADHIGALKRVEPTMKTSPNVASSSGRDDEVSSVSKGSATDTLTTSVATITTPTILPPKALEALPPPATLAPKALTSTSPASKALPPTTTKALPPPTTKALPPTTTKALPPTTTKALPPPTTKALPPPTTKALPPTTTKALPPPTTKALPPTTTKALPPTIALPPTTTKALPPTTTKALPPTTTIALPPTTTKALPPTTTKALPPTTKALPPTTPAPKASPIPKTLPTSSTPKALPMPSTPATSPRTQLAPLSSPKPITKLTPPLSTKLPLTTLLISTKLALATALTSTLLPPKKAQHPQASITTITPSTTTASTTTTTTFPPHTAILATTTTMISTIAAIPTASTTPSTITTAKIPITTKNLTINQITPPAVTLPSSWSPQSSLILTSPSQTTFVPNPAPKKFVAAATIGVLVTLAAIVAIIVYCRYHHQQLKPDQRQNMELIFIPRNAPTTFRDTMETSKSCTLADLPPLQPASVFACSPGDPEGEENSLLFEASICRAVQVEMEEELPPAPLTTFLQV